MLHHDREHFIKSQVDAVNKALNKYEAPLKPKHARSVIVGTHQEKSSGVFWSITMRIELEKHPVLTWKFFHLLHKLLRDGHRRVAEESARYLGKIDQLGKFWQHLTLSGYGVCNTTYAKMLFERISFHRKVPAFPGNMTVSEALLKQIEADVNSAFEVTIDMLDQMDHLLNLQQKVLETMDQLRWSSLAQQGQCLLAPLILVILDTSKFYDVLVKVLFKLHERLGAEAMSGHRERFYVVFRRTKKFYEEAAQIQYFRYLVVIPQLPASAPNFLQSSDLLSYRTPHAYERNGPDSEDGASLAGGGNELLVDLDQLQQQQQGPSSSPHSQPDPREERIAQLEREVEDERLARERILNEARSRIDQYETRLKEFNAELGEARRDADEQRNEVARARAELDALRSASTSADNARTAELEARIAGQEQKYVTLKKAYDAFREDHLAALRRQAELQKALDDARTNSNSAEDERIALQRKLDELERERKDALSRAENERRAADELRSQLATAHIENERLARDADDKRLEHMTALTSAADAQRSATEAEEDDRIVEIIRAMLAEADTRLPNAPSISFPKHLALDELDALQARLQAAAVEEPGAASRRSHALLFVHGAASTLVHAAAAASTASIAHYDDVAEQTRRVLNETRGALATESHAPKHGDLERVKHELACLHQLCAALPLPTGDTDAATIGNQLEDEMRRMDEAIRAAVAAIEEIQRRARQTNQGVKLEVNERILDGCNALMLAIRRLVEASRQMQIEIVAAGRGSAEPSEFYKRNHQWTEGLLSAAKAVGVGAKVLVDAADGVVVGSKKLEYLIVAAQEIAASTAQLFVSSRVKADSGSTRLAELSQAARSVNQCTAAVVASVRSGQETLNTQDAFDFSRLTLHEAKRQEMESQVKTLELEAALTRERARLAALRKEHFHSASIVESDGNSKESTPH